jgi:hypothetical protein
MLVWGVGGMILPTLYALLGACAAMLRSLAQHIKAQTFTPTYAASAKFSIAGIGGAVIGLSNFHNLSPAPLAVAFLVGYTADAFFSYLERIPQALDTVMLRSRRPKGDLALCSKRAPAIAQPTDLIRTVASIDDRLAKLQNSPLLDNFDGLVQVKLQSDGATVPIQEYAIPDFSSEDHEVTIVGAQLVSGRSYVATVQFDPRNMRHDMPVDAFLERIRIDTGNNAELVTFDVSIDAKQIIFSPTRSSCTFDPNRVPDTMPFSFVPESVGRFELFFEIMQKNRLIEVVLVPIIVVVSLP